MSWGTVLKLLVLAAGLRVVWGREDDPEEEQPDDPAEPGAPGDDLDAEPVPRAWSYADTSASPRHRRAGPLP